ncbi:MAG: hypothetical protein MUQ51_03065 [Pseudomonadota bacterium]|nr:hypothetical protein [Pseudomonadota bacterium]MDO7666923.1 hypothetical protein [Pseudomonadota bacterium]MDO7710587.1 hypothetical protein [Pseudomonadota bacterium]
MKNLLLLLFVIAVCWKLLGGDRPVELGPGVRISDEPKQTTIVKAESFDFKSYQITPLASFVIKAKVLSKNGYLMGRESDLSPIDLALGWKKMSDETVLNQIEITQSGRWYHWQVQDFPIPRTEIETQSANMHLIPASKAIESMIKQVKHGQIIDMRGYLVRVDSKDGWHWLSSLTRNDTGAHACELVFVQSFNVSVAE